MAAHRPTRAQRPIRVTVDTGLVCRSDRGTVRALDDRVLLEVKTRTERDPVLRSCNDWAPGLSR